MRPRVLLMLLPLFLGAGMLRWAEIAHYTMQFKPSAAEPVSREATLSPYQEEVIFLLLSNKEIDLLMDDVLCMESTCTVTCPWGAIASEPYDMWEVVWIGRPSRNVRGYVLREYMNERDKGKVDASFSLTEAPFRWSLVVGSGLYTCPLIDWRYTSTSMTAMSFRQPCHAPSLAELLWIEGVDGIIPIEL